MDKSRTYRLIAVAGALLASMLVTACSSSGAKSAPGKEPGREFVNVDSH
jgi:hypothetical protein